ncbi:MAG: hypothetical protein ACI4HI_18605 [Lachnospiraceae bacterium]
MESKKMQGFYVMDQLGLNHHLAEAVKDMDKADYLAELFGYQFSIRTDREYGITKDLPFFLIDSKQQYDSIRSRLMRCIEEGMILILSDGHRYDNALQFNMVLCIDCDGSFLAEYSSRNVPLRHMYRFPDDLAHISGNINERYQDWDISNRIAGGIDLRELESILNQLYLMIEKTMLYRRYLELSVYKVPCGTKQEPIAYWEI